MSKSDLVATRMPGVQTPHCKAAYSMNFCCKGCRLSPSAIPSTVEIDLPSASAPKTRQEHTSRSSKVTEQAPQSPVPQPSLAPVRCNLSRRQSSKVSRGSHRNSTSSPFTVVLTWILLMTCSLPVDRQFWRRAVPAPPPHWCGTLWCRVYHQSDRMPREPRQPVL